jgi:uncharacterized membrane protein YfcA
MHLIPFEIILVFVSVFAGLIGALIGIGGGIIITPFLVLAFGIDIRYAMGAALTSVIATSSGAAAAYIRDGISNMKLGMFLSIATTVGALCGASLALYLDQNILLIVFGAALLISAILSFLKKNQQPQNIQSSNLANKLQLPGNYKIKDKTVHYAVQGVIPGFIVMNIAGFLSGLLGIGSGAFKVLGMDFLMKLPFKVTTATSNFMIGVTAAASVGIYFKSGFIDPLLAAPVALGVLVGAYFGAKILPFAPVKLLKIIFTLAIFLIGIQMILEGFQFKI